MDATTAVFPLCAHIKSDGHRCAAAAMRGGNFCFQHIGGRISTRARSTTTCKTNLNLAHPGNRESIQHNLALVAEALNQGKLDIQTANTYIRLYRVAEQNLTRWEKAHKDNPDKRMAPLSDDAVEASHQAEGTPSLIGVERTSEVEEQQPPPIVIPTEASIASAVEGPAVRDAGSTNNQPASNNAISRAQSSPLSEEESARRHARFTEIDRLYRHSPDYADRVWAAIAEMEEEERTALAHP